VIRKYTGVWTY